jgi:RNA polymerase sigma factor (sigma-70 family)
VLLQDGAALTDGQLLEEYISRRDEEALGALVQRHGPMVWGVCRRVLRNYHDAEDAFQATFLVLVRKAASIVPRGMVANWLHGVAHQTALKARATAARTMGRERQVMEMPEAAAAERGPWRDLQLLLDEELSRLPDKYRSVIVQCDLEGKTRKEAARHLGCPEGTVAGRLARARVMLAKRLARRGLPLSGGALAAVLAENVASASVPTSVISATMKAASLFAAGKAAASGAISVQVAALTEGVLKAMLLNKLKIASAVLLIVVLIGIGGGVTALRAGEEGGRIGYQPPGVTASGLPVRVITGTSVEVALDAAGGRAKPYFYYPPDPNNINHLWQLTKVGDHYMIVSKLGELALDASGGKGNPYLRHSDPTNINHLWQLMKVDECYLILPKVGGGELTLDANGGKGNPYLRKADTANNNHLWQLRKVGDYYMLVPLVRRVVPAVEQNRPIRDETRREIESLVKKAEAAGADRQAVLEEIEKAVKEMKEKAKQKE